MQVQASAIDPDAKKKLDVVASMRVTLTVGGADVSPAYFCGSDAVKAVSLGILHSICTHISSHRADDPIAWTVEGNGLSYVFRLANCRGELRLGAEQIQAS